ncbi:MAG: hypothetical protein RLY86_3544 [Pseudomonadota bacterium]|jgi:RNA polymerase sigma-70 factor (ECF subfamily)
MGWTDAPGAGPAKGSGDGPVGRLVADLFRSQAGLLTGRLARLFGPGGLTDAEEVVQETLLAALHHWPYRGIPEEPAAWLWQVARNRALDRLRHRRVSAPVPVEAVADLLPAAPADPPAFRAELEDDRLALVFACCHPLLSPDARVALTLKTVCGLSTGEIARAFLVGEPTLAQRLVRAKSRLAEAGVPFAIPDPAEMAQRLASVLETIYLLFNEGYEATAGDSLIRADIAAEALRLAGLLAAHPVAGRPEAAALAALLCLQAARLPARADATGLPVLLPDQDRGLWDQRLLAHGFSHLRRSLRGGVETRWHLEAAIASVHAAASGWARTDWPRLVTLYDRLLALHPSPVVALNRAIALAEAGETPEAGAEAALAVLIPLADAPTLRRYPHYHAAVAEMQRRAGRPEASAAALGRALALDLSSPARRLLQARLDALRG